MSLTISNSMIQTMHFKNSISHQWYATYGIFIFRLLFCPLSWSNNYPIFPCGILNFISGCQQYIPLYFNKFELLLYQNLFSLTHTNNCSLCSQFLQVSIWFLRDNTFINKLSNLSWCKKSRTQVFFQNFPVSVHVYMVYSANSADQFFLSFP